MSKQLSAEWEQRIKEEAEKKHPFIWPKNKHGEEIGMRVGQSGVPGSAKARKIQRIYIDAVTPYASQLIEAQERIKELEECIREFISLEESTVGYAMVTKQRIIHRMKEALSPVNPQKNSHDSRS